MITATLFEPARVWLRRGELDRRLALGADPNTTPELSRRARQLTSGRRRAGLAEGLRGLIDAAEDPQRGYTAAVPLRRREILSERGFLLDLADDLASDDQVSARGVALIETLLTDGSSPVYSARSEGELHRALTHARAALYLG